MNRSEEYERLTDEIIGEAVLTLLKSHGPISTQALIVTLGNMKANAGDSKRQEAIQSVMTEVTAMAARKRQRARRPDSHAGRRGNVLELFGSRQSDSTKKMH
ncbi:hypothetical protein I6M88_01645 [Citrobacter sedlakii]|uniref:Fumarate hydratase n=1 Tax=Citrobacter sedlakii TaxID=67826 RepID=A0ABS0ZLL4_9ENTR|nr:hypothetical protein [Citrobacter sedlakii]MBJ8379682.1 hypothetical protein [Citrobacter sedlakii]